MKVKILKYDYILNIIISEGQYTCKSIEHKYEF